MKKVLIAVVVLACLAYPSYKAAGTGISAIRQFSDKGVYEHVIETANCIPEEERNSVLGYEVPMRWYTIADIMPCSRYCGWQEHYMQLSPEIETEISQMFAYEPPTWIVTKASAVIDNKVVKMQIEENYSIYRENSDFVLYRRN